MERNRVNTLPNPSSYQRNDKILIEGYKNFRENQGDMSRTSLKVSGKTRELFLEIMEAVLNYKL